MESETMISSNSSYTTTSIPFNTSYQTPPYTFINHSACPEVVYKSFIMNEDVIQMQQIRFPTPPITPPRGYNNTIVEFPYTQPIQEPVVYQNRTQQQRTKSVIMKVGHDRDPEYLRSDLSYNSSTENIQHNHFELHDQKQLQSHNDTSSSGTSSPTSHIEYICDWIDCGSCFESLERLAHHVTLIHAVASLTDGLYYCKWTGCQRTERGFNARYKMLVHVRTHTKEKPHQCHLCNKRFSRAENLKIHIRSHSGEKPYICTFEGCNKAYSNSSDRFKHTRTHSMEKPYMCKVPGCLKRYTDPSSLRKHVKTFKHSIQIMDFKATANVQQKTSINKTEEDCSFPFIKPNHNFQSYLILANGTSAPTTHDSFCIAMEEMCHIKPTITGQPPTNSTLANRELYWLQDSCKKDTLHYHQLSAYQQSVNYNIQFDYSTDKPLDLTVKRC